MRSMEEADSGSRCPILTVHSVPPRGVFVRILHEQSQETASVALTECGAHHIAVHGEAVNSNVSSCIRRSKICNTCCIIYDAGQ